MSRMLLFSWNMAIVGTAIPFEHTDRPIRPFLRDLHRAGNRM